jgi:hypothetical protein
MRHTLSDEKYNIDLTDDQSIHLVLAGKIYVCDGLHAGAAEDNENVYHCAEGYKFDLSKIESLIVRV